MEFVRMPARAVLRFGIVALVTVAGGAACARMVGGSISNVYSRTNRPLAHDNSRITSTNGS